MPRLSLIPLLIVLPVAAMATVTAVSTHTVATTDPAAAAGNSGGERGAAPLQDGSDLAPQPSPQDRGFIEQFTAANVAETELAELAVRKSRQEQVSALARQLASDSRAARDRLHALTQPLRLSPPPAEPDADHKTLFEQLSAASVQDFDRLYVDSQVRDHEDQVSVLEMQVSSGDDAELKKFAADILPLVREHLQRSRQLSELLKAQR